MLNKSIYIRISYYPIGQGLFTSGEIYNYKNMKIKFRWIYDCGTSTKNVKKILIK